MKRVSNEYSFIFYTCKASPLILRQYEISNVFNWLQFFATDEAKSPYNWEQRDKFNFYWMNSNIVKKMIHVMTQVHVNQQKEIMKK